MLLRRVVAALLLAPMLHLSAVAAGACTEAGATALHAAAGSNLTTGERVIHQRTPDETARARQSGHHDHAARGRVTSENGIAREATPRCDSPVQSRCCASMVGCQSSGIIVDVATRDAPMVPVALRISTARTRAPHAVRAAPEPPPPKA